MAATKKAAKSKAGVLSDHEQFTTDMRRIGFQVEHYNGRHNWSGPAVRVDDSQDRALVMAATRVACQWDSMGLGYIVYPVAR